MTITAAGCRCWCRSVRARSELPYNAGRSSERYWIASLI
jgi:hypothetical protein